MDLYILYEIFTNFKVVKIPQKFLKFSTLRQILL